MSGAKRTIIVAVVLIGLLAGAALPASAEVAQAALMQTYSETVTSGHNFGNYICDGYFEFTHTFPYYNQTNMQINSVQLVIRAYDVDSNVANGEFDSVMGDGSYLNPQFLQGSDDTWSDDF